MAEDKNIKRSKTRGDGRNNRRADRARNTSKRANRKLKADLQE